MAVILALGSASIDPRSLAGDEPSGLEDRAAAEARPSPSSGRDEPTVPAPADLSAELALAGGSLRLVVKRPGYLVALLGDSVRAAGRDWVAVRLEPSAPSSPDAARVASLRWETVRLDGGAPERGVVSVGGAPEPRVKLAGVAAPAPVLRQRGVFHACDAYTDGFGGFTVLCRTHGSARKVGVANLTGAQPLDDAWIERSADGSSLARFGLPRSDRGAEARVLTYVSAATGFVVTVEAIFPGSGEPAGIVINERRRDQPTPFSSSVLARGTR